MEAMARVCYPRKEKEKKKTKKKNGAINVAPDVDPDVTLRDAGCEVNGLSHVIP